MNINETLIYHPQTAFNFRHQFHFSLGSHLLFRRLLFQIQLISSCITTFFTSNEENSSKQSTEAVCIHFIIFPIQNGTIRLPLKTICLNQEYVGTFNTVIAYSSASILLDELNFRASVATHFLLIHDLSSWKEGTKVRISIYLCLVNLVLVQKLKLHTYLNLT